MKQKYLAVALSAVFAATALTGCGSDSDSNYVEPTPTPTPTPEPTPTPGTENPAPGTGNPNDNPGNAAEGNPLSKNTSVGGQQYVRGATSEFDKVYNNAAGNNANATVVNTVNIQNQKLDNIVLASENITSTSGVTKQYLRFAGEAVDGFSDVLSSDTKGLQEVNVANNIDVKSTNDRFNGLVSVTRDGTNGIYNTVGQENTIVGNPSATGEGSTLSTRIFGNKSLDTTNAAEKNSHRFIGSLKSGKNDNKDLDITGLDSDKFETTKLKHVQYGRVTTQLNPLDPNKNLKDNISYYQSDIVAKSPTNADAGVDSYFYRGTDQTSIERMNALQTNGGTFSYAGHALMYGIDNSYHGNQGDPNSNSFGGTDKPVAGKGNFVEALVDMGERSIEGNVFNVWQVTPNESTTGDVYRKDNVVDFEGSFKDSGNSIKGTANLSYDTANKGTFKGSFFGNDAEELGGAFNSVDGTYGKTQWGGVFGAGKISTPDVKPPSGNAGTTETAPKNP